MSLLLRQYVTNLRHTSVNGGGWACEGLSGGRKGIMCVDGQRRM